MRLIGHTLHAAIQIRLDLVGGDDDADQIIHNNTSRKPLVDHHRIGHVIRHQQRSERSAAVAADKTVATRNDRETG